MTIDLRDPTVKRLYRCADETRNIPIYLMALNPIDAYVKATNWAKENDHDDWQFNEVTVMVGTFIET